MRNATDTTRPSRTCCTSPSFVGVTGGGSTESHEPLPFMIGERIGLSKKGNGEETVVGEGS